MSSIMRRRRGLKSAISILLSEGGGHQHPHPLSQEAIYATSPLPPRQRLRSINNSLSNAQVLLYQRIPKLFADLALARAMAAMPDSYGRLAAGNSSSLM